MAQMIRLMGQVRLIFRTGAAAAHMPKSFTRPYFYYASARFPSRRKAIRFCAARLPPPLPRAAKPRRQRSSHRCISHFKIAGHFSISLHKFRYFHVPYRYHTRAFTGMLLFSATDFCCLKFFQHVAFTRVRRAFSSPLALILPLAFAMMAFSRVCDVFRWLI